MKTSVFILASSLASLVFACGGGAAPTGVAAPTGAVSAEAINKSRCGACHAPRDPGGHTRAELEPILKRHKNENRAVLTDEEWKSLTDYLGTQ